MARHLVFTERDGGHRMDLPDGWHTTLQARRAWMLADGVGHIKEQRPFDHDRDWWMIEVIRQLRLMRAKKRLK
jgi:hypothetical protein